MTDDEFDDMLEQLLEERRERERKKRKIQKPAWLLDFSMAERVGFEPTSP